MHHPDQLLLHGHVGAGVLGQIRGVSTPGNFCVRLSGTSCITQSPVRVGGFPRTVSPLVSRQEIPARHDTVTVSDPGERGHEGGRRGRREADRSVQTVIRDKECLI